ncbi:MAG: HIT family protein [Bacteroidota bacterium]
MPSIFSRIINKEFDSYIIDEDEYFIAILDIMPLREGHVLVIPKKEIDKIYELPVLEHQKMFLFASKIAKAIEQTFHKRIGYSVIGLEVPHAHLHLVPIESAQDINFNQPKLEISKERLKEIQEHIISNLS